MAGVFNALLNALDNSNPNIRIVAISDGEVWDTDTTLEQAAIASSRLKSLYSISASAVRLFTSSSQPDTRALASILQLNTANPGSIIDVCASSHNAGNFRTIIDTIGTSEGFVTASGPVFTLSAAKPCFRQAPWMEPTSSIQLNALKADSPISIWLDSPPEDPKLNGVSIEVKVGESVTHDTLNVLLEDKIKYFLDQLRILKVLNSATAKEEFSRILNYFKDLEDNLPPPEDLAPLLRDGSLTGRFKYMKASLARKLKSVSHTMETIVNDDRIASLNLAQQADYLRQASTGKSRTTRGLARRAEASGMDFDATVRAEMISMAAHFDDLEKV